MSEQADMEHRAFPQKLPLRCSGLKPSCTLRCSTSISVCGQCRESRSVIGINLDSVHRPDKAG